MKFNLALEGPVPVRCLSVCLKRRPDDLLDFACNQIAPGIKPDIMIMAKGIANGFPLSAIATRKELSDLQPVGSMGGTYAVCLAFSSQIRLTRYIGKCRRLRSWCSMR